MALTPELIAKFNAITGNNVSPTGVAPVQSRADRIREIAKQNPAPIPRQTLSDTGEIGKNLSTEAGQAIDTGTNYAKGVASQYRNAVPNFMAEAGRNDNSTSANPIIRTGENALGATVSGLGTVFAPITTAVKQASDAFAAGKVGKAIEQNPITGKLLDFFSGAGNKLNEWTSAHPEAARNLFNGITLGLAVAGEKPVTDLAKKTSEFIPTTDIGKGVDSMSEALVKGNETKAAVKQMKEGNITDLIKQNEETMTPTMKKNAITEGRQTIKTNKLGGTEVDYTPTKEIERAAQILADKNEFKNPVTPKDAPNVVYAKAKTAIAQRGAQAEKYLADNPTKVTNQEHADMFGAKRIEAEKYLTDSQLKAYDEQVKLFSKQLVGRKGGFTTENYYKALKDYEDNVASHLPKGKEALIDPTGVANANIHAASDVRGVVRDMIGSKHPDFKSKMYDLVSLYEARDNSLFNAGKTKSQTIFQKHPTATKIGAGLVGGATLEEIGRRMISH